MDLFVLDISQILKRNFHFIINQNHGKGILIIKNILVFYCRLNGQIHFFQNHKILITRQSSPHSSTDCNSFALEKLGILDKIAKFPEKN